MSFATTSSEVTKRTCNSAPAERNDCHPPSSGGCLFFLSPSLMMPSQDLLRYYSDDLHPSMGVLEPTAFREGASLKLLPNSDNRFGLVDQEEHRKNLECGSSKPLFPFQQPLWEVKMKTEIMENIQHHLLSRIFLRDDSCDTGHEEDTHTLRPSSSEKPSQQDSTWERHFQDLLKFKAKHGHCDVPHTYDENPSFARWARRQRFQYKLKYRQNKPSPMSHARQRKLESVSFVWDPQSISWEVRLAELMEFKMMHGHCNVPSRYPQNPSLGTWVKGQRKSYKKYKSGAPTNTSPNRFQILTEMGFQWKIRDESIKHETQHLLVDEEIMQNNNNAFEV